VDDADLAPSLRARGGQVLVERGRDVFRAKRMQVERVFDRDALQTAGLSVVAFVTRAGSIATGSPQTHDARKLPPGAMSARGTSTFRPSLMVRSLDHRRSEPEMPPAVSTHCTVSSPEHFEHTVQK
jgi:hypothetical protein